MRGVTTLWASPLHLVAWLNGRDSPARHRIAQAIDLAHALIEAAERERRRGDLDSLWRRDALERKLNHLLGRYRSVPRVYGMGDSGDLFFRWEFERLSQANMHEWNALNSLMELSRRGMLLRIRRCALAECRRWLYGRSSLKRFCSEKCKRAAPEHRERMREYMRRYYHDFQSPAATRRKAPSAKKQRRHL